VRPSWDWPARGERFDASPLLSVSEHDALHELDREVRRWRTQRHPAWQSLRRLVDALAAVRATLWAPTERARRSANNAVASILLGCVAEERTFWSWDAAAWRRVCGPDQRAFAGASPTWASDSRQYVLALAYLLGDFTEPLLAGGFERVALARKIFGPDAVALVDRRVVAAATGLGYRSADTWGLPCATWEALLLTRSPDLTSLSGPFLDQLRTAPGVTKGRRSDLYRLHRVLASLDLVVPSAWRPAKQVSAGDGVDGAWKEWVDRWYSTSTLGRTTRLSIRSCLFQAGRWLAVRHPDVRTPSDWTRQHCATYVARVDGWCVGDYAVRSESLPTARIGHAMRPNAKSGHVYAVRQFFRDCQEWEWITRRFDPARALATPRSIRALIGPDPRVIDDTIWAKLMWAGLNAAAEDFPVGRRGAFYPLELLRALTLTWLFAGLRSDEISRLRLGCIRWQASSIGASAGAHATTNDVCLLDVPTNKTGTSFTKPVDPLVGQAIAGWEAVRPGQPQFHDRRTGAPFDALFSYRGQRVGHSYINDAVIPTLCRKAGVPASDARGRITSHRARSTIASQLYNAKDPMTLFELQAWLGHRSPSSTQHYARITPMTLAKAYSDAGYFARNVRAIEVLLDRDAVQSGAAASGTPWQHFDLGHGYCTYNFFEQCPHRMACARCEFYVPKDSTQAQLLEAKGNLQRMLVEIPLTDDERAAVEDGGAAVDRLLERLADVPTPPGRTPRELGLTLLPMVSRTTT
jgi:integrase